MNALALVALVFVSALPGKAPKREFRQRAVTVTDTSGVVELLVSAGTSTTVAFPTEVDGSKLLLIDPKGRLFEPQVLGPSVFLVPREDLRLGEKLTLQVGLVDGTTVPFLLMSQEGAVDLKVDVELELSKKASAESVQTLKATVTELHARLDECQSTAAEQGAAKIAALIVKQDFARPETFIVERQSIRSRDKQSRLLVHASHVYRLFNLAYLVLTVENRDPTKTWVMERAEVGVTGGGSTTNVKVVSVAQELNAIPPAETSKVVVAFTVPAQDLGQRFTLKLLEKAGPRHVELSDLKL